MSKYMEIEVNGEIYKLVAGFGFLHEVNKKVTVDVPNTGKKKEVGLKFMVASIIDGDIDQRKLHSRQRFSRNRKLSNLTRQCE